MNQFNKQSVIGTLRKKPVIEYFIFRMLYTVSVWFNLINSIIIVNNQY
jgi:hypothetical protein